MIAEKAIAKLRNVTRLNGAIDWSQGDTKDIGVFSQIYDIMPMTQGFALRALYSKGFKDEGTMQKREFIS